MKIDGKIEAEERQYIHLFIKNANISESDKNKTQLESWATE